MDLSGQGFQNAECSSLASGKGLIHIHGAVISGGNSDLRCSCFAVWFQLPCTAADLPGRCILEREQEGQKMRNQPEEYPRDLARAPGRLKKQPKFLVNTAFLGALYIGTPFTYQVTMHNSRLVFRCARAWCQLERPSSANCVCSILCRLRASLLTPIRFAQVHNFYIRWIRETCLI